MGKVILIVLAVLLSRPTAAKRDNDRRVILIMVDGLRWQDVYTGADAALVANNKYTRNKRCIKDFIGIDDTTRRRAALMPFVWSYVQANGLMIGNRTKGSIMQVANTRNISYPGYSETLCGHPDDERIKDNGAGQNPNINLLEVANRMVPIETAPEIIPDVEKVMKSMERSDQGHTLRFRVPQDCATHEFFLEPYNGIHFSRYAVYLHLKEK